VEVTLGTRRMSAERGGPLKAKLAAGCAVVALAGLFDPALGKMERPSEEPAASVRAGS
jgi:hypothetical protein